MKRFIKATNLSDINGDMIWNAVDNIKHEGVIEDAFLLDNIVTIVFERPAYNIDKRVNDCIKALSSIGPAELAHIDNAKVYRFKLTI